MSLTSPSVISTWYLYLWFFGGLVVAMLIFFKSVLVLIRPIFSMVIQCIGLHKNTNYNWLLWICFNWQRWRRMHAILENKLLSLNELIWQPVCHIQALQSNVFSLFSLCSIILIPHYKYMWQAFVSVYFSAMQFDGQYISQSHFWYWETLWITEPYELVIGLTILVFFQLSGVGIFRIADHSKRWTWWWNMYLQWYLTFYFPWASCTYNEILGELYKMLLILPSRYWRLT